MLRGRTDNLYSPVDPSSAVFPPVGVRLVSFVNLPSNQTPHPRLRVSPHSVPGVSLPGRSTHPTASVQTARATKAAVGTPAYVYDAASLKANAAACLAFPNAYGLTVRYAMKSLPNKAVLQLFHG